MTLASHIASISRITFRFSQITFFLERKRSENSLKSERLVRGGAGGKVMRENEPVLLVLSAYDGKLFLRKGEFYLRNVSCGSLKKSNSCSKPDMERFLLWLQHVPIPNGSTWVLNAICFSG